VQDSYIQDGRYVVEIPRTYTKAKDLLKSKLETCGLGKHVSGAIEKGYHVLKGAQITKISGMDKTDDKELRIFLRKYFRADKNAAYEKYAGSIKVKDPVKAVKEAREKLWE